MSLNQHHPKLTTTQLHDPDSPCSSLGYVTSISPEILSAIFMECAYEWRMSLSYWRPEFQRPEFPQWISVSQVCRHWRNIAKGCALLWSHFFRMSVEWVDIFLERSKTAPLAIRFDLDCVDQEDPFPALSSVVKHMDRILDISIRFPRHIEGDIGSYFVHPAPLLHSFEVNSFEVKRDFTMPSSFIIRNNMFKGVTHGLRKLHLSCVHVDWSSSVFTNLIDLTLDRIYDNSR